MIKKLLSNKIIVLIIMVAMLILLMGTISLAGGAITASVSNSSININGTTTLTIKVSDAAGRVDVSSNSSCISLSKNSEFIDNGTTTITITGKSAGTATITVKATDVTGYDEIAVTGTKTVTVKVVDPTPTTPEPPTQPTTPTKSSDAKLTNIITSPVDFSGFSSSKTSGYSVNEGTSDRINVSVKKSNSNSSINIVNKTNGDTGKSWVYLKEGENEIQITCTAEDGKTTKTYTIVATREKATEVTPAPVEEKKDATLKSLKIEEITFSPEFKSDVLQYTANLDDEKITKLNIEAIANKTGAEVTIEGNSNLVAGTNAIKIKVTDGEETKTYTIVVTKAGGEEITNTVDENTIATTTEPTVTNKGPNMILLIIIGIVALIVFAALISLIVTKIRFRKQNSSMDSVSFTGFTSNDDETEQIEKPKKEKKTRKDDDDDDDGLGGTRRNGKHF